MKASGQGKVVLFVEDEMDMRFFLKTLLETSGFHPIAARNGKEGFAKARKEKPDIMIIDVMMPEEGGALLYQKMKTEKGFEDIPVIVLSAVPKSTFYHYLKMLNSQTGKEIPHPDAYVEKPPDPQHLLQTITAIAQKDDNP